ncbi:MAG TPA: hypothetical protein VF765_29465 [Polyangiaceae bacterium]
MASRSLRVLLPASLLFAMLAVSSSALASEPSAADKETARGLMAEGRADRDKNDLKGALKAFAGADAIMHVPTTGLELARAQAAVGQLVEARDTALRVTRSPSSPGEPAPFKAARDAASALNDQLEARIPSLTVNVKNVPSGMTATLTIDGVDLPSEVIGQPRKLDPGHHVVEAKAGTAYGKQEVDVAEKDSKEVSIELPAQSVAPAAGGATDTGATDTSQQQPEQPAEPEGGRSGGSKVMIFGGFGLAAVGAIAGTVTGLMSMSQTSSIKNSSACSGNVCNSSKDGDISSAKTLATVSTISFIAGGVGLTVGVIGLFVGGGSSSGEPASTAPAQTPSDTPASDEQSSRLHVHVTPWIGLGSAGLSGTF